MSDNRTIEVAKLPTTRANHFVQVSVTHRKGRGYTLSIQPMEDIGSDGFSGFRFTLFSGESAYIAQGAGFERFNRGTLEMQARQAMTQPAYADLLAKVLAKNPEVVLVPDDALGRLTFKGHTTAESQPPRGWASV